MTILRLSSLVILLIVAAIQPLNARAEETVGTRPYEMIWANRTQDLYPPLIDFENVDGWEVESEHATSDFDSTRELQLWGEHVGKLSYRADSAASGSIRLKPARPIPLTQPWDTVSFWVWANTLPSSPEAKFTPALSAIFQNEQGMEVEIALGRLLWKEWFVLYHVLTPEEKAQLTGKCAFNGFRFTNIRNQDEKILYFDNFAVLMDKTDPLWIPPRPQRGIPMLDDSQTGFNTGSGKLPFPTRSETILPTNLAKSSRSTIRQENGDFLFEYQGEDGSLTYRLRPKQGTWSDIQARWDDQDWFLPLADGGVRLWNGQAALPPEKLEHQATKLEGDEVRSSWIVSVGKVTQSVTYVYRLWGKSLVIDTLSKGGNVSEVVYGGARGVHDSRMVWNPFMRCDSLENRPGVLILGRADSPLFLAGNTDWYLSNASEMFGRRTVEDGQVFYQGGTRYLPKTDGRRNDCYERFFLTIAPQFEEVLPNIPNPKSPWKNETATRVWMAHGASPDRQRDKDYFARVHRYGIRDLVITDHETMWRDNQESFTFRTKTAPGKGGDPSQEAYTRFIRDQLGYLYGPYNNFTDFAPVNEYWSPDLISRTSSNQLGTAWYRCYAPKPALAVDFAEKLPPLIQKKFHFGTAYCDVHTAVSPWSRTDYDARVPGAGTFAATFYAYGEIMLLQKQAWQGPVYSEGRHQWLYSGLTDGNYGQDPDAELFRNPWLVDFNLRKVQPLNNNFGMGNPGMFWGREQVPQDPNDYDPFFAAEIAFGHTGFFLSMGADPTLALRSYYMPLKLHSRYARSEVKTIRYADDRGNLLDTSQAVASGAYRNSQIVTEYQDGTVTIVNGSSAKDMRVSVGEREVQLPPYGYAGWSQDRQVDVYSGRVDEHRIDYSESAAYLFIDGRGKFTRWRKSAADGPAICRIVSPTEFEIIPVRGADCGFAFTADSVEAVKESGEVIGAAQTRNSRGLTYILPVEGAFSYRVKGRLSAPQSALACDLFSVTPGQELAIQGSKNPRIAIPKDAALGTHYWHEAEPGQWIDFLISKPIESRLTLAQDQLQIALTSHLPTSTTIEAHWEGQSKKLAMEPHTRGVIAFPLPDSARQDAHLIEIKVVTSQGSETLQAVLSAEERDVPSSIELPTYWKGGLHSQGKDDFHIDPNTGASVARQNNIICGGVNKAGVTMHPPYKNGVSGSVFLEYDSFRVPDQPTVFRAQVGKRDGSDPGDGIDYRIEVSDGAEARIATELHVIRHGWHEISADLSPWAEKTVKTRLIADPGSAGNTSGDWAAWADMGLFQASKAWHYELSDDVAPYLREPGPHPADEAALRELRSAKRAWLHYQGLGLSGGTGQYGSEAVLNGITVGPMAPAGGKETLGEWADAKVLLTPEAISRLKPSRNQFELHNPGQDSFALRRIWIELEMPDGQSISSRITTSAWTQPQNWAYGSGIKVPFEENIRILIDFQ